MHPKIASEGLGHSSVSATWTFTAMCSQDFQEEAALVFETTDTSRGSLMLGMKSGQRVFCQRHQVGDLWVRELN